MNRRFSSDDSAIEISVGRFRVRPHEGLVDDGKRSIRIEPQVMALLVYLADNTGRVVSRDELLREVWGGTAVTDGAVTRCISVIRRTLDAKGSGDPIRTVPKRGYQLILPVGPAREAGEIRSIRARVATWGAAVSMIAAVVAGLLWVGPHQLPVRVAVQGFEDRDALAEQEQWGRSVTEELIAGIHARPGLTVVSDPSDEAVAGAVLSGSVRREGGIARVYSQLTDTRTREVLSAGWCTIPATPRLEIQQEWAGTIARRVDAALN